MVVLPEVPLKAATATGLKSRSLVIFFSVMLGGQGLLLILVGFLGFNEWQSRQREARVRQSLKVVASKLQSAGVLKEALALYSAYLDKAEVAPELAFSLGELALKQGNYGQALRYFYLADSFKVPPGLQRELSTKIVEVLERLGKGQAANAELAARSRLEKEAASAAGGSGASNKGAVLVAEAVVARVGGEELREGELLAAIKDLPPELQKNLANPEQKQAFLQKYVEGRLLLRAAEKLAYGQDPEVQRELTTLRQQLLINKFLEKELFAELPPSSSIDEAALQKFFSEHKERYAALLKSQSGGSAKLSFAKVRPLVLRDYRLQQGEGRYQQFISKAWQEAGVELFPERLKLVKP